MGVTDLQLCLLALSRGFRLPVHIISLNLINVMKNEAWEVGLSTLRCQHSGLSIKLRDTVLNLWSELMIAELRF